MTSWFRRYLLPGFVFQSIIIAGGYGTGRELVEFFLRFGPLGGLLGMLLPSMLLVSLTSMASFEFARAFGTYDYRTFFQRLLGRGWFVYEIGYLSAVLLILAVIGSAAGTFLLETFGLPYAVGVVGLLVTIGFLVFKGTGTIERFFSGWSFLLYGVYIFFFAWSISRFGAASGPRWRRVKSARAGRCRDSGTECCNSRSCRRCSSPHDTSGGEGRRCGRARSRGRSR